MQKNRIDHAVRSRVLFTYVIWCNTYPYLPFGAKLNEPPSDSKFRFAIEFPSEKSYYDFTNRMQEEQISYFPVIKRRRNFWVKWLEPTESDSLTTVWAWRIFQFAALSAISICVPFAKFFDILRQILLRA